MPQLSISKAGQMYQGNIMSTLQNVNYKQELLCVTDVWMYHGEIRQTLHEPQALQHCSMP